jgi:hypothetical protein
MSNNFKKVLYIGAWDHIEIVDYFPNCDEFILIDTQPRSQWDINTFCKDLYQKKFIEVLINKFKDYGFILDIEIKLDKNFDDNYHDNYCYINPHLFLFKSMNTQRVKIIKYYISTNILYNMTQILEQDIMESDTLYVAGYFPDKELLKYIKNKINFVGDDETIYNNYNDQDENNIIYNFNINNNINDYFDSYYLVYRDSKKLIKCDNLDMIIAHSEASIKEKYSMQM